MNSGDGLSTVAKASLWPTPTTRDWKSGDASQTTLERNARPLNEVAKAALWSTPRASDGEKGGANQSFSGGGQPLPAQAAMAFGRTMNGSSDQTTRRGALNPDFVAWLMGIRPEYLNSVPWETRSSAKSSK